MRGEGARQMLNRAVALLFILSAVVIAAEAKSNSFVCKVTGELGRPIRFDFYDGSGKQPKTDIKTLTVSMRTEDDRWKAMWSVVNSGGSATQAIGYGVAPAGFTTMLKPQKLIAGRVYAASAIDQQGGSAHVTFGFDDDGKMIFPDSFDQ